MNKRTRSSILITSPNGQNIVFDTTPEFRIQALAANLKTLDAVVYTHIHSDHAHGFDDLRPYYFLGKGPVPCYMAPEHQPEFRQRFAYAFGHSTYQGPTVQIDLKEIPRRTFTVGELEFEPIWLPHGGEFTVAFRIGRFAYATDFKSFTADQIAHWRGKIDVMVASALQPDPHPSHSSIPETIFLFHELRVKRGILTHMGHRVDYHLMAQSLPTGVEMAYDGMEFEVE